jgi:TRAP-type mannitol/chloroaromatic compound transport system substrate-binding protein
MIMSVRESQPAMASGVVDAIEMNSPWVDQIMGFQKLAKYYYYPGWQEPTTNMNLGMNLDLWKGFSKDDQAKLRWAIESGIISNFGRHYATNIQQLARLKKENPKIEVLPFPEDVLVALGKSTTQLYADLAKDDPDFKKIWDSYLPFLLGSVDMTGKTDQPFINARAKVFA